ncbi:unnamed protein product, partial [Rotaria sp. Silwood1]
YPLRGSSIDIHPNARWQQDGITVAGGNRQGNETNQLSNPLGLYVDDDQTIYVADELNHRIVEWKRGATSGQVVAGGNGRGSGDHQLNYPQDVIIDKERDSLIISDRSNRRVVRWSRRNGTSGETILSNILCVGLTMDENGSLYVIDYGKNEVRRYRRGESQGTVVAGGNGSGNRLDQLYGPRYVFVDRDHSVYVSEGGNDRVTKWMKGAKQGIVVAGGQGQGNGLTQFSSPRGVVVDQLGTVYVADAANNRIMRWPKGATQGIVTVGRNSSGGQSNQLNGPVGVLGLLVLISLCQSMTLSRIRRQPQHDPDADFNITQLIQSKGYPCEEHKVITKDGYILGVFRIPHGRKSSSPGRPVLLQHGLIDSAATWVMNFPDQSLGFMLADAGYDVWLGNVRGNYYSRAHVKYNPDHDTEFWNFSWDDMARDDLPSMIYYILNVTQQTQISYVGHSQGTLIGFAQFGGLSNIVQNNVSFFGALAPVAHITHIKSPLKHLFNTLMGPESFWHLLFGNKEFLASSNSIKWLAKHACGNVILNPLICENVLFILCGPDNKNLNATRTEVYISHEPDGTSVKNMIHFAQMFLSKQFQAYDYGSADKNRLHYNQTTPPIYSIRPMKVPTAIFSSGEDWLADPEDVAFILDNIQNLVYKKYIPDYNHLDFVWALTANKVIYQDLINQMQKYHPSK